MRFKLTSPGLYSRVLALVALSVSAVVLLTLDFGFKEWLAADYRLLHEQPLTSYPNNSTSFYDLDSVPPAIKSYINRVVARAPDCETDTTALQVRCCGDWPCGGTADRIRGISGLLVAATAANRTLCFTRSWLAPGPHVDCPGRRVWIGPSKENDRGRIAVNGRGSELTIRSPELLRKASYVGSSHPAGIPEIGVPRTFYDVIMAERNFAGAKKLGFVALALSGVIDAPFVQSRSAVLAAVALSSRDEALLAKPDFVALHVRCGGSVFTNSNGQVLKCLDMNDGMTTSIPDLILAVARDLPRETDCARPLFVGSDSDRFIAELKLALPKRMPVVTCCSSRVHIDDRRTTVDSRSKQHFVDLAAFGAARSVFATRGGYAELGASSSTWRGVRTRYLHGTRDKKVLNKYHYTRNDVEKFVKNLLTELGCR